MSEQDPVAQMEQTAKQIVSTMWEIIRKKIEEQRQNEMQQKNQLAQNQFAAQQQEKMLDSFKSVLKESGVLPSDKNVQLLEEQTTRLADVADRQKAIDSTTKEIDERLERIDQEQDKILNPPLEGEALDKYQPDREKLRELQNEKNGLKGQKGRLKEESQALSSERESILNGKTLKGLELDGPKKQIGVDSTKGELGQPSLSPSKSQTLGGPKLSPKSGLGVPGPEEGPYAKYGEGTVGSSLHKEWLKAKPSIGPKVGQGSKISVRH